MNISHTSTKISSSLWVILIDSSGSMGEGFTSSGASSGFVEQGAWEAKLDAAKELLIRRLQALRTPHVAVIEFNHDDRLLFVSHASEASRHFSDIQNLSAGGGTDLAAALRSIKEVPNIANYRQVKILVITDGLSDAREAESAARDLLSRLQSATIAVLLVDQTSTGDETAFRIATNEDVTYAQSYLEMNSAVGRNAAELLRSDLASVTRLQRSIINEQLAALELPGLQTISLQGSATVPLTSSTLINAVLPLLQSLETLQSISDRSSGRESQIKISSISQSSPVEASVSGIAKAVEVAEKLLVPWKREHAQKMADLEEKRLQLEIAKTHAEALKVAEECDVLRSERKKRQAEAEHIELKNERIRFEVEEERMRYELMRLARRVLVDLVDDEDNSKKSLHPNYPEVDEVEMLANQQKALAAIQEFMKSPYMIEVVNAANDKSV